MSDFEAHMSDADALMWNIEKDPLLRSTIVTVLLLDRPPDPDALRERLEWGSEQIPRMRQRVASPMLRLGPPYWSADPNFDLDYHVRRVRVPEPGGFGEVLHLARIAAMSGFDRARPLWEYTVVEGLPDERCALVLKVHHSMTDGIGGMKLLLMLFDLERDAPAGPGGADDALEALAVFGPVDLVRRSLDHRRRRFAGLARRSMGGVWEALGALRHDPVGTIAGGVRAARSVAEFLAPATVPHSSVMRERTLARDLDVFDLPLDDFKRTAKALDASVNDVFVAGVIGGLHRYHLLEGADPDTLRMVMPINLRGENDPLGGNHFTPARFLVPMRIEDPAARVAELRRICRSVRAQPAVRLTDTMALALNQLPTSVTTSVFGALLKGADFVTTNVPGAPFPLYLAGAGLERMYAFAPLAGTAANVALVSYDGTCCIGINVDAVAIADRPAFRKCVEAGLDEVLALT